MCPGSRSKLVPKYITNDNVLQCTYTCTCTSLLAFSDVMQSFTIFRSSLDYQLSPCFMISISDVVRPGTATLHCHCTNAEQAEKNASQHAKATHVCCVQIKSKVHHHSAQYQLELNISHEKQYKLNNLLKSAAQFIQHGNQDDHD